MTHTATHRCLLALIALMLLALLMSCQPAAADRVEAGMALNTHTAWTPNLTASYLVAGEPDDWAWRLYLDGYLPIDFSTAGAGISIAPPAETPILSDILNALQIDRGGIAAVYDFDAEDWTVGAVGIVTF